MLDEQTREVVVRSARTAQIITVALCLGVTVFAVVVLAQRGVGGQGNLGILTMTAMVLTVAGVPAGFLVGQQIIRTARSRLLGDTEAAQDQKGGTTTQVVALVAAYQNKLVIAAALLEGPCFLALLAYLNEGHAASLAVAGVCLLGILARFPTVGLTDWLERQLQLLREERQFSA